MSEIVQSKMNYNCPRCSKVLVKSELHDVRFSYFCQVSDEIVANGSNHYVQYFDNNNNIEHYHIKDGAYIVNINIKYDDLYIINTTDKSIYIKCSLLQPHINIDNFIKLPAKDMINKIKLYKLLA